MLLEQKSNYASSTRTMAPNGICKKYLPNANKFAVDCLVNTEDSFGRASIAFSLRRSQLKLW